MNITKSEQVDFQGRIVTTILISSSLRDGTTLRSKIVKEFENSFDSDNWFLLKRELLRTEFLRVENVCHNRIVRPLRMTQFRKRLFS